MNDTSADLDRRLAEHRQRSKERHVEFLDRCEDWYQRRKRSEERYKRFGWLYWSAGITGLIILILGSGIAGWALSEPRASQISIPRDAQVIIVPTPASGSPEQNVK